MNRKKQDQEITRLQAELVELQDRLIKEDRKIVIVLEGRDTAGKDGVIRRITEHLNPRRTRVVALPKPTEREQTQWYFQRYVRHLPAAGELTIFNRSWYNRVGVEVVMGFCSHEQASRHLKDTRRFENMLVDDDIVLIKIWLDVSKETQAHRLEVRMTDPMKRFKLSELDKRAQEKWDAYSRARDTMFRETHTERAPWYAVVSDNKHVARAESMRVVLNALHDAAGDPPWGHCNPEVVFTGDLVEGRLAP